MHGSPNDIVESIKQQSKRLDQLHASNEDLIHSMEQTNEDILDSIQGSTDRIDRVAMKGSPPALPPRAGSKTPAELEAMIGEMLQEQTEEQEQEGVRKVVWSEGYDGTPTATSLGLAVTERDQVLDIRPLFHQRSDVNAITGTEGKRADSTFVRDGVIKSLEPSTVMDHFKEAVNKCGTTPALAYQVPPYKTKTWLTVTWRDYYAYVRSAAKAIMAVGTKQFGACNIVGFNSTRWMIANFGTIFAGALCAGVYTTNTSESCKYVADDSRADVIFVENRAQLEKYRRNEQSEFKLDTVKAYVIWSSEYDGGNQDQDGFTAAGLGTMLGFDTPVYDWEAFMQLGDRVSDDELEARINAQTPGHCCTLVYTSGTTGNPKGVMISHDNITWTAQSSLINSNVNVGFGNDHERTLSYLPLSHVAGQLMDVHTPVVCAGLFGNGYTTYLARPDALKGSLVECMKACKPTAFFAVPRVYEKFYEGIMTAQNKAAMDQASQRSSRSRPPSGHGSSRRSFGRRSNKLQASTTNPAHETAPPSTGGGFGASLKARIANWAKGVGAASYESAEYGNTGERPWGYSIANSFVFKKVLSNFGLQHSKLFISGAAPLSPDTQAFLASLGMVVTEGYGMSESCGGMTASFPTNFKRGSTGFRWPGTEMKILGAESPEDEGEICFRGRHVMMGYLNNAEKTNETIDTEGWLHSGDVGRIDADGFLYITGRIKDLIITAGGENVAPSPIEDALKSKLGGCVSQVIVCGDKKKYLTALVTLNQLPDPNVDGAWLDKLAPSTAQVVNPRKPAGALAVQDGVNSVALLSRIQEAIDWYNGCDKCVSNAQKVQYFKILPGDLSSVGELPEITATLKVKRAVVLKKRVDDIEAMYQPGYSSLNQA